MSVELYDKALSDKIRSWTEKTDISVYTVEESSRMFEVLANKTNDNSLKLPLIAIKRPSGYTIKNPNKKPLTFDGLSFGGDLYREYKDHLMRKITGVETVEQYNNWVKNHLSDVENDKIRAVNAIPINLPYVIDIYTRYQKENDVYLRNLVFNLVNYPTLRIDFETSDIKICHNGNIILGTSVSNNSSSVSLGSDQICKQSIEINIDDAYLWDVRPYSTIRLDAGYLEIADSNGFISEQL